MKGMKNAQTFGKELILKNRIDCEKMEEILLNHFKQWKGEAEQTDDVCVLGVELI